MRWCLLLCLVLLSSGSCIRKKQTSDDRFMAFDHQRQLPEHMRRRFNNLIRRVHKERWTIGYAYADPEWGEPAGVCPPEKRNNGKAIEEVITKALQAWLQPVRDMNTGKPVVNDFRYVPNFDVKNVPEFKLYDLRFVFFCDFGKSHALTKADEAHPPQIKMHQGTDVTSLFSFHVLHEIGHSFGLLDTYPRRIPGEEFQVSRGGLKGTIGHQPASIMSGLNRPLPLPTRISQDDANGIVWLYKFYHENLPLEDCIFLNYELEKSPDGCRPKHPLIFEIKHGTEKLALQVMADDENIDIDAQDRNGATALHHTVLKKYQRLLDRLLSRSGTKKVNAKDINGATALHYAVLQKFTPAVQALLAHKSIDAKVKDKDGTTPLQLANALEHEEIAELIADHIKAKKALPVEAKGKKITTWGEIKAK